MDSDRVFCFLLTKNCSSLGVVHVIVLCHVSLKNDEGLNHMMIDEGHAVLSVANIKKADHLLQGSFALGDDDNDKVDFKK